MCLPFLMEKAKSFSNSIVANASDPDSWSSMNP
jgi:hypothetical protein